MRWNSHTARGPRSRLAFMLAALLATASGFLLAGPADEKRISIYSTAANYSLTVTSRNGTDYVGLLEILEPLGSVSAQPDGPRWKVRYNDVVSEFTPGKKRGHVGSKDFDLPGNFLVENGRGLVPLSCLGYLLPRILGGPVTLNETARRLFVGNVGVHFTAQVSKTTPPKLVINFTSPVNPMIATEPGKLRMVFTREPLIAPGPQVLTFDNKVIPSASFREDNGAVEVDVISSVPVMASYSNDGRTITIAPPPSAPVQTPPAAATAAPGKSETPTASGPPPASSRRYFAVVDASHGGDERGAALSDQLAEKDITLAFARQLRQALEARGLPSLLLRDGDTTLTLDQRASLTNSAAPAIYICVHAASLGSGIRVYTGVTPAAGENRGPFLDWNAAQASFAGPSSIAALGVAAELRARQVPVRTLSAPLRPLNNITAAAIAIEVAVPATNLSQLSSLPYQQLVATAVAAGVADVRDKLQGSAK